MVLALCRYDSQVNIQDLNPLSNIVLDEEGSVIEIINPLSSPSPLSSFTISQSEWNNPKSPGNGEAVIFFCGDHDGYTMRVGYKNGKKNGAASLCYPDGIVYMNAHFVDDVQKGEYRIRNEDGNIIE